LTPILHPNINWDGELLLDALSTRWCPAWTVQKREFDWRNCRHPVTRLTKSVLLGIVAILGDPDWENSCMGEVLEMHNSDPARFEDRVKLMTKKYALRDKLDENQSMKAVYKELQQEV
jgi:ubiquitin-protein ligase